MARVADNGRLRRHVLDHHGVGTDLRVSPDGHRPEQLGARADRDVVVEGRVALASREPGAAQRHALVERHPVADLGGLRDHHSGAVIDEEVLADLRRRVDLDAGDRAARVGDGARGERNLGLPERVGNAMGEQRLHARPTGEDLERPDPTSGGIALAGRGDVARHLLEHSSERS
jgi:hypothetical protein